MCFILFDAMVNWIISLISLSPLSLLVHRNISDFCVLILYPATLLNSLIRCNNFLIVFLAFSMYRILCLQTGSILLLLSQCEFLFFLSFLVAMDRTSKTMLNSSGKSGHPCLVPDLRENAFSFSPLKMMFSVSLSYMTSIMLK